MGDHGFARDLFKKIETLRLMGGNVIKSIKRSVLLFGAALLAVALVAPAAHAATATPKTGYSQFKGCPSVTENPNSLVCVRTVVTGGNLKMGSKNVPIEKPIVLIGGADAALQNFVYNSDGGLLPAKQVVPGGVIGLTGLTWLLEFFSINALSLYATTELAGTPDVNIFEEPVELPIKAHLETPSGVLGKNCYLGSNSNPISLNLITGTTSPPGPNKPITGKEPSFGFDPVTLISKLSNGIFVDNSFAAPGASGCTLTLFGFIPISLNSIVNLQAGVPSPAGTNETKQNFNVEIVDSETAYAP